MTAISTKSQTDDQLLERLATAISHCPLVAESALAHHRRGGSALWAAREQHPEVVCRLGHPHKLDISVPLSTRALVEREVRHILASLNCQAVLYDHVGDGSLHVNLATKDAANGEVESHVFTLAGQLGGSISAEHGIGVDNVKWLRLTLSKDEITVLRSIKAAMEPRHTMNPGVLFEGG